MKRIFSKTAFTLIELLVSLFLVSFIILGIFSITMVLNNNGQDYGQRYLVRSATQTTLNHILNNASLAVGTVNANDEAILNGAVAGQAHGLADPTTFCIHQQPTGVGSDIWLCYSWTNTVANPYQINWCAEKYTAGADPRGASSCSTAQSSGNLAPGSSITFLGTAYSIIQTGQSSLTSSPYFVPNNSPLIFGINIQNCLNNSLPSCQTSGISSNPTENPEVQLSGTVTPLQATSG